MAHQNGASGVIKLNGIFVAKYELTNINLNGGIMSKYIFTVLVLILLLSSGCGLKKQHEEVQPLVCVIAIDGTGSYKYLDNAKNIVMDVVNALPDKSKLYVRWITQDSNSDSASIVSAIIPVTKKKINPFDQKGKRLAEISKGRKIKIMNQVTKVINGAKSPKAGRTDIYGTIYAASERFSSNPDSLPLLILLTDMDDNVGNKEKYTIDLGGADVKILGYQVGPNADGYKKMWSDYLISVGAGEVDFQHIDEPLTIGGL